MSNQRTRTEAPNVKPGWKTTEFWLTMLASLASLLIMSDVIPTDSILEKVVGAVTTVLTALGYAVVRTYAKRPGPRQAEAEQPEPASGKGE